MTPNEKPESSKIDIGLPQIQQSDSGARVEPGNESEQSSEPEVYEQEEVIESFDSVGDAFDLTSQESSYLFDVVKHSETNRPMSIDGIEFAKDDGGGPEHTGSIAVAPSAASKAMDILDKMRNEYEHNLMTLINKMVEASSEKNIFRFKYAYDEFQLFAKENWTQVDYDIDGKTKKKIEEIFLIENSNSFTMYQYLNINLDGFMRFAFLITFALFLMLQFSTLYHKEWLKIIGYFIYFLIWTIYIIVHLKLRMDMLPDKDRSVSNAIIYYLQLRCCFPKRKKLIIKKKTKKEEEKQAK